MSKRIVSASSHPAALSVALHFYDGDGRINGSLVLNEADMDLLHGAIELARKNFKPWISEEFKCIDDQTWECRKCHKPFGPEWTGETVIGVIDVIEAHRLSHG